MKKQIYLFVLVLVILITQGGDLLAKSFKLDAPETQIVKKLSDGEGGFVIGYQARYLNKDYDPNRFATMGDVYQNGSYPQDPGTRNFAQIDILTPQDKNKATKLVYNRDLGAFVFMGPPGEYTIAQIYFLDGSFEYWKRVYAKVVIEPGQMKYVGEVLHFVNKFRMTFFKAKHPYSFAAWWYNPNGLNPAVSNILAKSGRSLVYAEAMGEPE